MHLKTILYWNSFDGASDYYFGLGRQPLFDYNCPVNTCNFTDDVSNFNQSDVVVFNMQGLDDYAPYRFRHQRFVFYLMESPDNTFSDLLMDKSPARYNYFNWTMTYRFDSDIVQRDWYGAIKRKNNQNHLKKYPDKNEQGADRTA